LRDQHRPNTSKISDVEMADKTEDPTIEEVLEKRAEEIGQEQRTAKRTSDITAEDLLKKFRGE
jgi:hypothetical protein